MAAYAPVQELPTTKGGRMPWDRQPTDTDKSWAAFQVYRDLGPDRSITAVATAMGISDRKWIHHWSKVHDWRARVSAYDADIDQQMQEKLMAKRWKAMEQATIIADAFLARVVARLRTVDVTQLTMTDLVAMTKLATTINREVYFPRADTGVNVNAVAQIIIDPVLIPPPTSEPVIVDADE